MMFVPVVFFLAAVSWIYAAYSAVKLAAFRKPDVPLSKLFMNGMAWFNKDNFKVEGHAHQRAFLTAFVAFFICIILAIALVMTQAPSLTPSYQFKHQ